MYILKRKFHKSIFIFNLMHTFFCLLFVHCKIRNMLIVISRRFMSIYDLLIVIYDSEMCFLNFRTLQNPLKYPDLNKHFCNNSLLFFADRNFWKRYWKYFTEYLLFFFSTWNISLFLIQLIIKWKRICLSNMFGSYTKLGA